MYRIAIVDELQDDLQRFQLYVHKNDSDKRFQVIPFEPNQSREELIADLLGANLDAIVTDYRLNEYNSTITYDGVDLVNDIQNKKHLFPCFVLTSFDDDAVKDSEDVNIVYIKGIMNANAETKAKATFLDRIEKQIQKYQSRVKNWTEELAALEAVKKERLLNTEEEERFVELSNLLDKSIAGIDTIPRVFYSNDTNSKLDSLLNLTDEILKKIGKK